MGDSGATRDSSDDPEASRVALSSLFRSLASKDRRVALQCLHERRGEWVGIHELAIAVADRDAEESVDLTAVKTKLYHAHLPMLTDAGLIEYDPQERIARYDGDTLLDSVLAVEEIFD